MDLVSFHLLMYHWSSLLEVTVSLLNCVIDTVPVSLPTEVGVTGVGSVVGSIHRPLLSTCTHPNISVPLIEVQLMKPGRKKNK